MIFTFWQMRNLKRGRLIMNMARKKAIFPVIKDKFLIMYLTIKKVGPRNKNVTQMIRTKNYC